MEQKMQHQDIDALIFAIITKHVPHEKKTRSLQRARPPATLQPFKNPKG
jgi:hypothetical protein